MSATSSFMITHEICLQGTLMLSHDLTGRLPLPTFHCHHPRMTYHYPPHTYPPHLIRTHLISYVPTSSHTYPPHPYPPHIIRTYLLRTHLLRTHLLRTHLIRTHLIRTLNSYSTRINQSIGLLDTIPEQSVVTKIKASIQSWRDRNFVNLEKTIRQFKTLTSLPKVLSY